ncbi:MAG: FGGY family carbohydrate kinase [Blautia sp.]|nr:FGGY family carbohydrate kinase [Blautia sp.]MCM1201969.1 FGGY family carbohydrate kinase [Bacteroides fragilis]
MNILIIDAGSSSMRGVLFTERGRITDQKQIKYHPVYGENGVYVEQDPLEYKAALWEIIEWAGEAAAGISDAVGAIGLTAQRSSCICIDHKGDPIGNAICWQDKRTIPICKTLEVYNAEIFDKSGALINSVFLGPKLTWVREKRNEVYKKVWKFMTIADYLMYLLTGNVCTDDTYASRTHLMNLETRAWDSCLLDYFSVERQKLCEIYPVGSCMGVLRHEAAMLTGLEDGTPIYSAGGDQQCALIGQGIFEQGDVSVTLGTGEFIAMQLEQLPLQRKSRVIYNTSAIRGEYIVEFGAVTCCSALDWFMREFYPDMHYENIGSSLSESKPGASGCIALPYFQGRMTPDHNNDAKAVFAGISLNTKKADLLRAFVEGIGIETCNGIEEMPVEPRRILVNGGLTHTSEICQILADALGRPIYVSNEQDATALGAYLVTMVSMGHFSNEADAYKNIRGNPLTDIFTPIQENTEIYQKLKEENCELYSRIYG